MSLVTWKMKRKKEGEIQLRSIKKAKTLHVRKRELARSWEIDKCGHFQGSKVLSPKRRYIGR